MMKLTNKEKFLMDIQMYLKNGGVVYGDNAMCEKELTPLPKKRDYYEVWAILNDKEKFLNIDILDDELGYFCLELEDFSWE